MLLKTPDEEKAARLLDDARVLLKKNGWHTGTMGAVGESHCLIGALREAGGVEDTAHDQTGYDNDPILLLALAALGFKRRSADSESAVRLAVRWNDDLNVDDGYASGKPRVLRRLRRAAAKLREKLFA